MNVSTLINYNFDKYLWKISSDHSGDNVVTQHHQTRVSSEIFFYSPGCGSLSMRGLSVPKQLILGQSASLVCNYDLEQSKLYSVKWYKDGQEFFRFMPSMESKVEVFSVRGVNVDVRSLFQ